MSVRLRTKWFWIQVQLQSLMAKLEFFLVLIKENDFSWCFHFKTIIGSSKKRYLGFLKQPSIWEVDIFLCDNDWKFWTFSALSLWNKFTEKRKSLYKRLEYRFLVESTKIENATSPCITALSEANVKTNRMESSKRMCIKSRGLEVTVFFFFRKLCFSLRTSYKEWI